MFDRIVIAMGTNTCKSASQPVEQRLSCLRELYRHEPRVEVISYEGLTIDAARSVGATVMLRGLRSGIDLEYERPIAQANLEMSGIETVFLLTAPHLAHVSSSLVRELSRYGRDTTPYLP